MSATAKINIMSEYSEDVIVQFVENIKEFKILIYNSKAYATKERYEAV